jgi:hypothetical protein
MKDNHRFGYIVEGKLKRSLDNLAEARGKFKAGENHVYFYARWNGVVTIFDDGSETQTPITDSAAMTESDAMKEFWGKDYTQQFKIGA